MKTTVDTLNDISKKYDNCSDYRMAKMLGVSRQLMSRLHNGHRTMSDELRVKAAELLEQEPDQQLIYGRIERAKCTESKRAWQHTLKKLTSTAAALLLTIGLYMPQNVEASTGSSSLPDYTLCALVCFTCLVCLVHGKGV